MAESLTPESDAPGLQPAGQLELGKSKFNLKFNICKWDQYNFVYNFEQFCTISISGLGRHWRQACHWHTGP